MTVDGELLLVDAAESFDWPWQVMVSGVESLARVHVQQTKDSAALEAMLDRLDELYATDDQASRISDPQLLKGMDISVSDSHCSTSVFGCEIDLSSVKLI